MLALSPSVPFFPTASELRLAAECVAPWALGLDTEDIDNAGMRRGRERHATAERLIRDVSQGAPLNEGCFEPWAVACLRTIHADLRTIHADAAIAGSRLLVEQGVRWTMGFGGEEAAPIARKPGERLRGAFCGTADLVYMRNDGVLVVADWKFGDAAGLYNAPAKDNPQLWFLALAFCAVLKISGSSASTLIARVELRRIADNGAVEIDAHDLTQGDLDRFASALAGLAERIAAVSRAMPTPSQACGSCKSRGACPAWGAIEAGAIERFAEAGLDGPPQTPEQAALLRHAIAAGKAKIEEWEEWRRAWHLYHPDGLPVGLGLVEKRVALRRSRVIQTPEAFEAIREHAGAEAVEMRPHATMESIRKAAREQVGGETRSAADRKRLKDQAEREVIEKLRGLGAIEEAGNSYKLAICRGDGSEVEVVDDGSY